MERTYKIAIVIAAIAFLSQSNALARNRFNDLGRDTGRAIGNLGHGAGRITSESGHIVVHGSGRIVKGITHGLGHAAKGY